MGITAKAWIGSVEVATLEWIERRDIELDELVEILAQALIAATLAASRLDPAIKLPPDVADYREGLW